MARFISDCFSNDKNGVASIFNHGKAKMDEFSAESNLQWAFNFVESTFTRKTVVENSSETQEQIKYVNQEDLKELLTNYGDTFTGEIFSLVKSSD